MENNLREVAIRINAFYDNEKTINILGFSKNQKTGIKTDLRATIFKYRRDGTHSKAYEDFIGFSPNKNDLLITQGDSFSKYKEHNQYIIKLIDRVVPTKFTNEEVKENEPIAKEETAKVEEVPGEIDL